MMDTAEDSFGPSNLLHKSRRSSGPHVPGFPPVPGPPAHQQITTQENADDYIPIPASSIPVTKIYLYPN